MKDDKNIKMKGLDSREHSGAFRKRDTSGASNFLETLSMDSIDRTSFDFSTSELSFEHSRISYAAESVHKYPLLESVEKYIVGDLLDAEKLFGLYTSDDSSDASTVGSSSLAARTSNSQQRQRNSKPQQRQRSDTLQSFSSDSLLRESESCSTLTMDFATDDNDVSQSKNLIGNNPSTTVKTSASQLASPLYSIERSAKKRIERHSASVESATAGPSRPILASSKRHSTGQEQIVQTSDSRQSFESKIRSGISSRECNPQLSRKSKPLQKTDSIDTNFVHLNLESALRKRLRKLNDKLGLPSDSTLADTINRHQSKKGDSQKDRKICLASLLTEVYNKEEMLEYESVSENKTAGTKSFHSKDEGEVFAAKFVVEKATSSDCDELEIVFDAKEDDEDNTWKKGHLHVGTDIGLWEQDNLWEVWTPVTTPMEVEILETKEPAVSAPLILGRNDMNDSVQSTRSEENDRENRIILPSPVVNTTGMRQESPSEASVKIRSQTSRKQNVHSPLSPRNRSFSFSNKELSRAQNILKGVETPHVKTADKTVEPLISIIPVSSKAGCSPPLVCDQDVSIQLPVTKAIEPTTLSTDDTDPLSNKALSRLSEEIVQAGSLRSKQLSFDSKQQSNQISDKKLGSETLDRIQSDTCTIPLGVSTVSSNTEKKKTTQGCKDSRRNDDNVQRTNHEEDRDETVQTLIKDTSFTLAANPSTLSKLGTTRTRTPAEILESTSMRTPVVGCVTHAGKEQKDRILHSKSFGTKKTTREEVLNSNVTILFDTIGEEFEVEHALLNEYTSTDRQQPYETSVYGFIDKLGTEINSSCAIDSLAEGEQDIDHSDATNVVTKKDPNEENLASHSIVSSLKSNSHHEYEPHANLDSEKIVPDRNARNGNIEKSSSHEQSMRVLPPRSVGFLRMRPFNAISSLTKQITTGKSGTEQSSPLTSKVRQQTLLSRTLLRRTHHDDNIFKRKFHIDTNNSNCETTIEHSCGKTNDGNQVETERDLIIETPNNLDTVDLEAKTIVDVVTPQQHQVLPCSYSDALSPIAYEVVPTVFSGEESKHLQCEAKEDTVDDNGNVSTEAVQRNQPVSDEADLPRREIGVEQPYPDPKPEEGNGLPSPSKRLRSNLKKMFTKTDRSVGSLKDFSTRNSAYKSKTKKTDDKTSQCNTSITPGKVANSKSSTVAITNNSSPAPEKGSTKMTNDIVKSSQFAYKQFDRAQGGASIPELFAQTLNHSSVSGSVSCKSNKHESFVATPQTQSSRTEKSEFVDLEADKLNHKPISAHNPSAHTVRNDTDSLRDTDKKVSVPSNATPRTTSQHPDTHKTNSDGLSTGFQEDDKMSSHATISNNHFSVEKSSNHSVDQKLRVATGRIPRMASQNQCRPNAIRDFVGFGRKSVDHKPKGTPVSFPPTALASKNGSVSRRSSGLRLRHPLQKSSPLSQPRKPDIEKSDGSVIDAAEMTAKGNHIIFSDAAPPQANSFRMSAHGDAGSKPSLPRNQYSSQPKNILSTQPKTLITQQVDNDEETSFKELDKSTNGASSRFSAGPQTNGPQKSILKKNSGASSNAATQMQKADSMSRDTITNSSNKNTKSQKTRETNTGSLKTLQTREQKLRDTKTANSQGSEHSLFVAKETNIECQIGLEPFMEGNDKKKTLSRARASSRTDKILTALKKYVESKNVGKSSEANGSVTVERTSQTGTRCDLKADVVAGIVNVDNTAAGVNGDNTAKVCSAATELDSSRRGVEIISQGTGSTAGRKKVFIETFSRLDTDSTAEFIRRHNLEPCIRKSSDSKSSYTSETRLTKEERKLARRLAADLKLLSKIEKKRRDMGETGQSKLADVEKSIELLKSVKECMKKRDTGKN